MMEDENLPEPQDDASLAESRSRRAFKDVLETAAVCGIVTFAYYLVKLPIVEYRYAFILEDLWAIAPSALGAALGSIIIPIVVSLFFKNKVRAFLIAWLFIMLPNVYLFYQAVERIPPR